MLCPVIGLGYGCDVRAVVVLLWLSGCGLRLGAMDKMGRAWERCWARLRRAGLVVALGVLLAAVLGVGTAGAASVGLSFRAPGRVRAGSLVSFSGRVAGRAAERVAVQRRFGGRWRVLVRGRAGGRGRFVLTWAAPGRGGSVVVVRAVVLGSRGVMVASGARTVHVLALRTGLHPVSASGRTQVLDPSVVSSVPAPGRSGKLVYAGGNDVQVGQIVAIGAGPATPDGFLARVTKVVDAGGGMVVSTVPATLLEAVPNGSLDATARTVSAGEAQAYPSAHTSATVTCSGSVKAQITQSMAFSAGIALKGSWTVFGGLLQASLTADADAKASLKAIASAAGACKLKKTSVLSFPGPSVETFVGPVPVVMTSRITVYLDADASVKASTTTRGPATSAAFSKSPQRRSWATSRTSRASDRRQSRESARRLGPGARILDSSAAFRDRRCLAWPQRRVACRSSPQRNEGRMRRHPSVRRAPRDLGRRCAHAPHRDSSPPARPRH
jgi:hypothetical protein